MSAGFLNVINRERAKLGLAPLSLSTKLNNAAQWLAQDMASKNYISHIDSLNRNPYQRLDAFGYNATTVRGENIAAGYSDPETTYQQWYDTCDPDVDGNCTYAHRVNMLNPKYKAIGIGLAYDPNSDYKYYWATNFGDIVDSPTQQTQPVSQPIQTPITQPITQPIQTPINQPISQPIQTQPINQTMPITQPRVSFQPTQTQPISQPNRTTEVYNRYAQGFDLAGPPGRRFEILTDQPTQPVQISRGVYRLSEEPAGSINVGLIILVVILILLIGAFIFSQV
jgi:hypothetical protein